MNFFYMLQGEEVDAKKAEIEESDTKKAKLHAMCDEARQRHTACRKNMESLHEERHGFEVLFTRMCMLSVFEKQLLGSSDGFGGG